MTAQLGVQAAGLAVLVLLIPAFVRAWRGPELGDRLLAIQSLGTSGTALLLLLAFSENEPGLVDAALVMALLSALSLLTLTRLLLVKGGTQP